MWRQFIILQSAALTAANAIHQTVLTQSDYGGLEQVRQKLIAADIIPNVIDDFPPTVFVNVNWKHGVAAELGNVVSASSAKKSPFVSVELPAEGDSLTETQHRKSNITIAMTDPDAPSRQDPKWAEFCHWIATGVPVAPHGVDWTKKKSHLSDIMPYSPPSPPSGTGYHRYILIAFGPQPGAQHKGKPSKPSERKRWGTGEERHGVKQWAAENGLVPLGANFFLTSSDD